MKAWHEVGLWNAITRMERSLFLFRNYGEEIIDKNIGVFQCDLSHAT